MNFPVPIAWLVDAVIVVAVVECLLLLALHGLRGRGLAPRDFLLNMLSGLSLMLALRCQVRDAGSAWVALCLLGAGAAHASDIVLRWRRARRQAATAPKAA